MLTIGFTTTYYTLWRVTRYQAWTRGRDPRPYWATAFAYLRNLSMDLDKAKAKLIDAIGEEPYMVDLTLRGHSSFETREEMDPEERKQYEKDYTFTFGKMKGADIRTAGESELESLEEWKQKYYNAPWEPTRRHFLKDVVWQLERAMKDESTARRKVYARRRLIELGELVRRDWTEKKVIADPYNNEKIATMEVKHKWMPKGLAKWQDEIGSKKGTFYTNKARVTLTITRKKSKRFDTAYGTMFVDTFEDSEGHIVTYKGSTPLNLSGHGETVKVMATIKHDRNETYIQRLKIIEHVNA